MCINEVPLIQIKAGDRGRCHASKMAQIKVKSYVAAAPIAVVFCCSSPAANADPLVEHGRALVEANCASCHAVGPAGLSPYPDAPPFRSLSARYPISFLAEALAEGISTGHPDMPRFVATPGQIEAILAYLSSLEKHHE